MRNITEEGFAYLRNINTQPGPNAGRSIDPSKPGPDVDRIASAPKRCWQKGANVRLKTMRPFEFFGTVYEQNSHTVTVIYDDNKLATFHADDLIEQETPSAAPSPGPQDVRGALEMQVSDLIELARDTRSDHGGEAKWVHPRGALIKEFANRLAALAQSDAQPGRVAELEAANAKLRAEADRLLEINSHMLHEAKASQSDAQPVGWFCQPTDSGKPTPRKWLLRFDDADCGDCYFDDEKDAYAAFERANIAYSCYLFATVPTRASEAPWVNTALPRLDASGLMKAAELPLDVLQSASEYLCMDWDPETTTAVEAVSVIWNIITNALRARAADRSGK